MSTFLELCVDLRSEAGISGTGPTSVLAQVGEMQRVVNWVAKSYRDVQNLHPDWDFLKTPFTFDTLVNVATYTKASVSPALPELGSWKTDTFRSYLTSFGVNVQQELTYLPWDQFRESYSLGSLSTQVGQPWMISVKPDQSLMLWPIPSEVYTITGEYYKRAQVMTANTDVPVIPQSFQDVIVWRALMLYGAYAAADEKYSHGQNEYQAMLSKLETNQLPEMMLGEPIT